MYHFESNRMKKALTTITLALLASFALQAQGPHKAEAMMQEEMKIMADALNLEGLQIYYIGQIIDKRTKDEIMITQVIDALEERAAMIKDADPKMVAQVQNEITNQKERLKHVHREAEEAMMEHLTSAQKTAYNEDLRPAIEELHVKTASTPKKTP